MIDFRNADQSELVTVLDWAADEGWNPGLDDAAAFFQADPEGFFVAASPKGALVAAISVVNHSDSFAFLGLYIVRPDWRGKGIGFGLWQHATGHAGARTIGLDGVEAQQENYAVSGFSHAGGTTRFSGTVHGQTDPDVTLAGPAEIEKLVGKEARASGLIKTAYLEAWLTQCETRKTLILDAGQSGSGFCTVRACREGAKIGPLVADNAQVADRLIRHAATLFGGPVTLDVPGSSSGLADLCRELCLVPGFRTARMYRGPGPTCGHAFYAVTSLELG
ncbi:GNAT family N-acetyltransferase [Roseobacter sp. S98]|uniref:GNAT family N-acetyltransferase n=1 Tax=Roseobacter algicola (ex Choi et al. 2025) (nom. illeg.) TaxID=3092138 RepID=UPI0035C66AAD